MNAITERWIGGCRRELLDRTLMEPAPSAADLARVRDPPQPAPAAPVPARRRAAETATRTGRSRPVPRPTTHSRRWPDQRISPGRMIWTTFSARTAFEWTVQRARNVVVQAAEQPGRHHCPVVGRPAADEAAGRAGSAARSLR